MNFMEEYEILNTNPLTPQLLTFTYSWYRMNFSSSQSWKGHAIDPLPMCPAEHQWQYHCAAFHHIDAAAQSQSIVFESGSSCTVPRKITSTNKNRATPRTWFSSKVNVPPPGSIQMDIHVNVYSVYWNCSFAFQPETPKQREQIIYVQLYESTLCTTAYAELFSIVLFLCRLDPAAPTAAEGEGEKQGKIKANIHLKQLCFPEKGNIRLVRERKQIPGSRIVLQTSSFRFVTGDELGNYSCECVGKPKSRLET